jgi:predicted dehydrogenase
MGGPGAIVVGTGFGARVHVPALRAAGFDVLALVGQDGDRTARRAERLGIPSAVTDLDAALELPGVVAVTIATPPNTHAEIAIAAAKSGKHVVCEKPFAMDVTEAQAMLDAAETAGVMHLVGHEFRWAIERAVAGRAIRDGVIGEPRFATFVSYVNLVADPEAKTPRWWFDPGAGGGWLGASGSHVVDQIRSWLGDFAEVSARLNVTSQRTDVHDADADGSRTLPVPPDLELPAPPPASDDPRERFSHLETGPYTRLCEVLRAGVDGKPLPDAVPIPTFADGVACMRVLDAVRASSAKDGSTVEISG